LNSLEGATVSASLKINNPTGIGILSRYLKRDESVGQNLEDMEFSAQQFRSNIQCCRLF
jgi:hypothetical protein